MPLRHRIGARLPPSFTLAVVLPGDGAVRHPPSSTARRGGATNRAFLPRFRAGPPSIGMRERHKTASHPRRRAPPIGLPNSLSWIGCDGVLLMLACIVIVILVSSVAKGDTGGIAADPDGAPRIDRW